MKAHQLAGRQRQAISVIEQHQLDLQMCAINMFETPCITFFVQQPHDEVEVAPSILQAVTARAGRGGVELLSSTA